MNLWVIIVGMGLVTFATRASFIFLPPHTRIPKGLQRALKYVAAAVLPALIVPDVLFHGNTGNLPFDAERLVAAMIGILVAWVTRNMVLTIVAGMASLFLQKWLLPL